jgi:hypothetical protein
MNKKYAENVDIINVEVLDIQRITAVITIKVREHELNCFVNEFHNEKFFEGDKYAVVLSLMTTGLEKINSREKNIASTKHFEAHCKLSGEIKEFFPIIHKYYREGIWYDEKQPSYKHGIVDCGTFVAVEILKKSDLKIGDYVKAEGRLDVRKVKEEN